MTILSDAPDSVIQVVETTDEITALDLEGEFDLSSAPVLLDRARCALEAGRHLIVNLSEATFIDSSTIHALFTAETAARDAGRAFVLQFGTHASVERVLSITGTDEALPTARTRAEAIELIDEFRRGSSW